MERIKFKKEYQRRFLGLVIERLSAPSLRGILQFGLGVPYSTLKNYYNESRLLPRNLFNDLCEIARIDGSKLTFEIIDENWGRVKGGQAGKRH